MPLYEYGCPRCQREFEAICAMDSRHLQRCPECGARARQEIRSSPFTDVYGHTKVDTIQGVTYTSRREYERKMGERGFVPAGDPIGGARTLLGNRPDPSVVKLKSGRKVKVTPKDLSGRSGTRQFEAGTA